MITQYFTYRKMPTGDGWLKPDKVLQTCYDGMDFSYQLAICQPENDGRILGCVEAENQELVDVLIEGLAAYAIHLKTAEKAKTFYEYATGTTITITNGKLNLPEVSAGNGVD